ncbi:MAG: hypothetical protein WCG80_12580 [Spirochaetales bacterium]
MNPKMLISAHVDHEVEAPWKDRLEELLETHPEWREEEALHRKVKNALAAAEVSGEAQSQAAVWSRLQASLSPPEAVRSPFVWWSYPAAAAVLALVLGAGFWLGSHSAPVAGASVAEIQVEVPGGFNLQLSGEGQLLKVSTLQGGAP